MRVLLHTHVVLWWLDDVRRLGARARDLISDSKDLPLHHKDPFDRLLVAQARCEGLTLVIADRQIGRYDVPILDAAI